VSILIDANVLVRKVDFLQIYSTLSWFLKERQAQYTALTIQPALCTIVPLSPNAQSNRIARRYGFFTGKATSF
jgi:hypothetical protein